MPAEQRTDGTRRRRWPVETEAGVVHGDRRLHVARAGHGKPLDFRSDQFSFGSILYEMVTGKRAFERATRPEILSAILRSEPEPIAATRSHAACAVALDRRAVPGEGGEGPLRVYGGPRARPGDPARAPFGGYRARRGRRPELRRSGEREPRSCSGRCWHLAGVFFPRPARRAVAHLPSALSPSHVSRRRHLDARFTPDGQTIVYAAHWEGKPLELYTASLDSPESRSLGLSGAEILSISSSGQMALLLAPRFSPVFRAPHSDLLGFQLESGPAPARRGTPRRRHPAELLKTCTSQTGARTASRSRSCAMSEARTGSSFRRARCSTKAAPIHPPHLDLAVG